MPVPSKERREFLEKARLTYQENLTDDAAVIDYLATTRGLSWDSVQYFRLGVVKDPLPGHEGYAGKLAIPYIAPNGDTLSIRFRQPNDEYGNGPKYLTVPGDKPRPFNTSSIERHSDIMCMTEGEIDTMTLHQLGLPSIGIPGANVWKTEWPLIFNPYRTVYVFTDGDDAGKKFGEMIADCLSNARIISMGKYIDEDGNEKSCDVNKRYLLEGADAILRKVKL